MSCARPDLNKVIGHEGALSCFSEGCRPHTHLHTHTHSVFIHSSLSPMSSGDLGSNSRAPLPRAASNNRAVPGRQRHSRKTHLFGRVLFCFPGSRGCTRVRHVNTIIPCGCTPSSRTPLRPRAPPAPLPALPSPSSHHSTSSRYFRPNPRRFTRIIQPSQIFSKLS